MHGERQKGERVASQLEAVSPHAEARFTTSTAGIDEYLPRSTSFPAPQVKVSIARHRTASAFKFLLQPLPLPSNLSLQISSKLHEILIWPPASTEKSHRRCPWHRCRQVQRPAFQLRTLSLSAVTVWCTRPERNWLVAMVSEGRLRVDIRDGKFPSQHSNITRDREGETSKHPHCTRGERAYNRP